MRVLKEKIKKFNIDTSHFLGHAWSREKTANSDPRVMAIAKGNEKYTLGEVFCKDSIVSQQALRGYTERHQVIPYKCGVCRCDGH